MVVLGIGPRQAIEQIQHTLGLSDSELAHALSASPRTLKRWRVDGTYPQHETRARLAALVALSEHLTETFQTHNAIQIWMHTSNRYLGGFTPTEAVRAGRSDRVAAALEALDSGIFI
jgi:uncharacterized protein (DUF2384 family)